MQVVERHNDPILLALLNMLGVASLVGFLYCVLALLIGVHGRATIDICFYLIWFSVSMLSVVGMRAGSIWGAYALGIATGAITIYDFVKGNATIGGATLGILVVLIVALFIRSVPQQNDPINSRNAI